MTPFRDAMCFIDGDTGQLALGVDGLEAATKGLAESIFGSNVEEAGARVTYMKRVNQISCNGKTV